jgi:hypothetical protein
MMPSFLVRPTTACLDAIYAALGMPGEQPTIPFETLALIIGSRK